MIQTIKSTDAKKVICFAFLTILILCTTISGPVQAHGSLTNVSQSAIDGYFTDQADTYLSDEEKIKSAIQTYFTIKYEGQKALQEQDYSLLLESTTVDWVKKENDKREIEIYIASLFDLRYLDYHFTLDYDEITIKDHVAIVDLKESHQVVYEALAPEVSELFKQEHTFTLHMKNGSWLMYKDDYHDEYSDLLRRNSKEAIKNQVFENYELVQAKIVNYSEANTDNGFDPNFLLLPSYQYNRSAANTFSYNNALITNAAIPNAIKTAYQTIYGVPYPSGWPTVYTNEDANGGDCTNFVSQAIFEGTNYSNGDASYFNPIPNDSNWYYLFSQSPKGSTTWISVGWFHDYLINVSTSKRGPYGVDVASNSLCTGINPGDPIFMKQGSSWAHTVIVYSKSSPCTSPNNIKVNSHNSYRRNEPLSTWSGFSWFGVYIQGYRK